MGRVAAIVVAVVGAIAPAACNSVEVLPFPDGQGQKKMTVSYPAGPYGLTKGDIIDNFAFTGFYAPQTNADPNALQPVNLGDFYNPTGTDMFPAGSPYGAGNAKPRVLFIDIGASWCSPCKLEAKEEPPIYGMDHPNGAEFLMVLADGPTTGATPVPTDLRNWVMAFKTAWPAVIDPERKFVSNFGTSFPVNILIDTKTMKIVDLVPGQVTQQFYDELATLLAK